MRNWFERLTASPRPPRRAGGVCSAGNGLWLAVGAVAWLVRFLVRRPERRVVVEEWPSVSR